MNQCSRQVAGTTSHQRLTLPATGGGTVCQEDCPEASRTHEGPPTGSYQDPLCSLLVQVTVIRTTC